MNVLRALKVTGIAVGCVALIAAGIYPFYPKLMSSATFYGASNEFAAHHNLNALNLIEESIKLDPQPADSYYLRAAIKVSMGGISAAAQDYEIALSHGYNPPALATSNAALMNHCNGRLREALEQYKTALNQGLDDRLHYSNMSDIYYRLGDVDNAMKCANKALKIKPDDPGALGNRAQCWLNKEEYQKAIDDTNEALKHLEVKNAWDSWLEKTLRTVQASAYFGLNKDEEAEVQLNKVRATQTPKHSKEQMAIDMESQFKNKIKYARFTLCTNLSDQKTNIYADFLSRFLTYVDRNICTLDRDFHVRVFIFANQKQYQEFAQSMGRTEQLFGNYDCDQNSVFTYDGTGLGAIAHETMHKVIENVVFDDVWAHEGIPTLFEKFYGYKHDTGYNLMIGFQNPGRIQEIEPRLLNLPLVDVLAQMYPDQNESEVRLLGVFLQQKGKLKKYLEVARTGKIGTYPTVLEATFDKTAEQLEPYWREYLQDLYKHRQQIATTPPAEVFANQADFDLFAEKNYLRRLVKIGEPSADNEYRKKQEQIRDYPQRQTFPGERQW